MDNNNNELKIVSNEHSDGAWLGIGFSRKLYVRIFHFHHGHPLSVLNKTQYVVVQETNWSSFRNWSVFFSYFVRVWRHQYLHWPNWWRINIAANCTLSKILNDINDAVGAVCSIHSHCISSVRFTLLCLASHSIHFRMRMEHVEFVCFGWDGEKLFWTLSLMNFDRWMRRQLVASGAQFAHRVVSTRKMKYDWVKKGKMDCLASKQVAIYNISTQEAASLPLDDWSKWISSKGAEKNARFWWISFEESIYHFQRQTKQPNEQIDIVGENEFQSGSVFFVLFSLRIVVGALKFMFLFAGSKFFSPWPSTCRVPTNILRRVQFSRTVELNCSLLASLAHSTAAVSDALQLGGYPCISHSWRCDRRRRQRRPPHKMATEKLRRNYTKHQTN